LWQILVATTLEAEDAVAELLGRVFDRPAAVYTSEETKLTNVSVYFERRGEWSPAKRKTVADGLRRLRSGGLTIGSGAISLRRVKREDWAESWKRHFKAIEIGPRLLVRPGWVRRRPRRGQAVVVLDPGLSFGTGNHPTTGFCLRALTDFRQPGQKQSFWDVGTGSGILAIAAAKLGYNPVRALDFDPEAVRVARQNSRRNRTDIEIRRQDLTKLPARSRRQYSFICANLISDLLLARRNTILARLSRDGALAVAGILRREFPAVRRAFEQSGLRLARSQADAEWQSGLFVFR
jgi:ribosomal protein L11 methyltransferase